MFTLKTHVGYRKKQTTDIIPINPWCVEVLWLTFQKTACKHLFNRQFWDLRANEIAKGSLKEMHLALSTIVFFRYTPIYLCFH